MIFAATPNLWAKLRRATLTAGASIVGFLQAGAGSVVRTVASKLGDEVTVWDKIPEAEKAAILAGTSVYNAAASLNLVAAERRLDIPEGYFVTDAVLTVARGIKGRSAHFSRIHPSANDFDAVKLTATDADFQQVSDLTIAFSGGVGTGHGIVLADTNNNVEVARCNVQYGLRGFSSSLVAFMQRYQQCRADFCTTGFYAQGLNGGGGGAGTTLIYDQCYATNGCTTGWNLNNIVSVEMIQPTTDMGGMTNAIVCTGVGKLNIFGHHFEGTPSANGAFITYSTSGSLAGGITVIGGCLEANDLSARTYQYLNIQANDDTVRVVLIGVKARNLTGGANAKLAKLAGAVGSHIEIIAINCDFGALEGLFDTASMSGTWSYRRIDQEKPVLARGVTSVAGGGTIATGVSGGLDGKHVFVQVRNDTTNLPTVAAHVTETYSGADTIQVKFSKLTDGTNDAGTYPVQWMVIG